MQNQSQQPAPNPQELDNVANPPERVTPAPPEVVKAAEQKPEQTENQQEAPVEIPTGINPAPAQPQQPDPQDPAQATQPADDTPITEDQAKSMDKNLDKRWTKAADDIIDKFEDKPYEEEEAHEDIQIKYLWQRFRKKISRSKE